MSPQERHRAPVTAGVTPRIERGVAIRLPIRLVGRLLVAFAVATTVAACSRSEATTTTTVDPMVTWCDIAVEMTQFADDQAAATSDSPDEQRAALARLSQLLHDGQAVAPSEIAGDVATAAERVDEVAQLLASVDYDDSRLTDDLLAKYELAGGELAQASAVITGFNQRYCGVGTDDPDRDQAIAALIADGFTRAEASCLYEAIIGANGVDQAPANGEITNPQPDVQADPQSDPAAIFASCGIGADRLDEYLNSLTN